MRIKIGKRSYRPSEIRKAIIIAAGMTIEFGNQLAENLAVAPPAVHTGITIVVGVATTVLGFAIKNAGPIDAADDVGEDPAPYDGPIHDPQRRPVI